MWLGGQIDAPVFLAVRCVCFASSKPTFLLSFLELFGLFCFGHFWLPPTMAFFCQYCDLHFRIPWHVHIHCGLQLSLYYLFYLGGFSFSLLWWPLTIRRSVSLLFRSLSYPSRFFWSMREVFAPEVWKYSTISICPLNLICFQKTNLNPKMFDSAI